MVVVGSALHQASENGSIVMCTPYRVKKASIGELGEAVPKEGTLADGPRECTKEYQLSGLDVTRNVGV